jgi:hypothetical protein
MSKVLEKPLAPALRRAPAAEPQRDMPQSPIRPNASASASASAAAAAPVQAQAKSRSRAADLWVYLGVAALLWGSWEFSHREGYSARSNEGYWIGVAGAAMLVLLFAYPLRKRSATLARWGKAKYWFIVHMVLGIMGPVLILVHSGFKIGSVNAGVALFSMLVVAGSGIIGRFIYLRVHTDLGGQRESIRSMEQAFSAEDSADGAGTVLRFAPLAQARLLSLQKEALQARMGLLDHARSLFVLPLRLRRERRAIARDAVAALRELAQTQAWDEPTLRRRERRAVRTVSATLRSVKRVAQLAAYSRLFSLWHVLHVPFVFLMVICAVAHVVAVHAY